MPDMTIQFDASEQLSTIRNAVEGPETATHTEADFTETDNGDGTFHYAVTETVTTSGEYMTVLRTASDDDGNDGASTESEFTDTFVVGAGGDLALAQALARRHNEIAATAIAPPTRLSPRTAQQFSRRT